jgi:hypothetical protein
MITNSSKQIMIKFGIAISLTMFSTSSLAVPNPACKL